MKLLLYACQEATNPIKNTYPDDQEAAIALLPSEQEDNCRRMAVKQIIFLEYLYFKHFVMAAPDLWRFNNTSNNVSSINQ